MFTKFLGFFEMVQKLFYIILGKNLSKYNQRFKNVIIQNIFSVNQVDFSKR